MINALRRRSTTTVSGSLESLLEELTRYGNPRIARRTGFFDKKRAWHASIEMDTAVEGASFEVKSEYDHATPLSAVLQLMTRVNAAVNTKRISE